MPDEIVDYPLASVLDELCTEFGKWTADVRPAAAPRPAMILAAYIEETNDAPPTYHRLLLKLTLEAEPAVKVTATVIDVAGVPERVWRERHLRH
jgi:hypothetical protein